MGKTLRVLKLAVIRYPNALLVVVLASIVACEQAPSEVWKKDSASEERDSVSEASGTQGSL